MARRIQLRRDTAANWSSTNPVLAQGEIGIDLTNSKIKIGNGTSAWNSLSYWDDKETALSNYAGHIIPSTDNTYDLGAPDKQWRDIFVSNGSVYIGDIKLSNDNGTLKVQQVTDAGLVTETPVPNAPGAVTTDRLVNGVKEVVLDRSGTLTTPSLLPRSFTATLDSGHYAGEGSLTLTGPAWYFAVEFRVNANGTVETVITNNTPWPSNPGYTEEMPFAFTEADHGIPNYTFGLSLRNLINPGPAGWTTNLTATLPPVLPATIKNPEAVKITADATSWTFGADGSLAIPGIIKQGGARLNLNENDAGTVYLTSSANDTTALYMPPNSIQLYADIGVTVSAGTVLTGLEAVYNDQLGILNQYWIQVSGEPGYPWGITQPLSQNTYDQLVALNPGTISIQPEMISKANDVRNAWTEWQNALQNTVVAITAGYNEWTFTPDGKMKLPAGGDIVDSNNVSVLGGNLGLLKISGSTIGTKDDPDTGNWGSYGLYLDPGGESWSYIQIPSVPGQTTGGQLVIANNNTGNGGIRLSVNTGNYTITDAGLEVPYNHHIRQNNSWTRVTTPNVNFDQLGTIVWTSTVDYISSAKLIIQVEADEAQDATGWHSQACEAIISCRGYANTYGGPGGDPQMVVYGVVHTSANPLVTFTVRRNPGSKLVEVIGTLTATAASAANLRIHSVEMSTRD